MILYQGPSALDGAPIVAIATGLVQRSANVKTGDMVQVWILRADVDPVTASRIGADVSICGACPHRGAAHDGAKGWAKGRSCYVNLIQAPRAVFAAFTRGSYPVAHDLAALAPMLAGRGVRLGAYGDPAAVPFHVWQALCPHAAYCNGYTHAWRSHPELAAWCMASADSAADRIAARFLGFRTFRVREASSPVLSREVVCPASEEAGKRTSCASCRACGGHSAKAKTDIVIVAHGGAASNFREAA